MSNDTLRQALQRLANAIDDVGVRSLDSDCLPGDALEIQAATESVRTLLAVTPATSVLSHLEANFWLANRSAIVGAINAAGFDLCSTKDRIWLEQTGAPAASAEPLNGPHKRHL